MYYQALAKDVPVAVRGPFGMAKLELKDDAVPLKAKHFRLMGEKEVALKWLVNKYQEKQWIVPTNSEWGS